MGTASTHHHKHKKSSQIYCNENTEDELKKKIHSVHTKNHPLHHKKKINKGFKHQKKHKNIEELIRDETHKNF